MRLAKSASRLVAAIAAIGAGVLGASSAAQASELIHRFNNPSFGEIGRAHV